MKIRMREHEPKKGQPHKKLTWRSKFFLAGDVREVPDKDARILLGIKSEGDGQPLFVEDKGEEPAPPPKTTPAAASAESGKGKGSGKKK